MFDIDKQLMVIKLQWQVHNVSPLAFKFMKICIIHDQLQLAQIMFARRHTSRRSKARVHRSVCGCGTIP